MILIWSELYGCMNPMRVAFYYSGSIIVGALMIYIYRGFAIPWLFVMTSILPIFSLLCAARSFNVLPGDNLPSTTWAKFSAPWKIIILMAIYAFAYGLLEKYLYAGTFGPHSALGNRRGRARCYGGRCSAGQELRLRHHIPHGPAAYGGRAHHSFGIGPVRPVLGQLCATGGYTAFSILIMLILANICYRYGVSAIWLFGIERGVRALFMMLGRYVDAGIDAIAPSSLNGDLVSSGVALLAIIGGTVILFSERELASRWVRSSSMPKTAATPLKKRHALVDRCDAISKEKRLIGARAGSFAAARTTQNDFRYRK